MYRRSIVLVHGLQGHPYRTWACKAFTHAIGTRTGPNSQIANTAGSSDGIWQDSLPRRPKPSRYPREEGSEVTVDVFWPRDFLPEHYPKARILTWGYDSKIVKGMGAAANKSSTYSYPRNLTYDLAGVRQMGRRLVFVAHSLGGIITKEMCTGELEILRRHLHSRRFL